jgi:uncharacterized membrane protein YhaH (DUF805 family)/predicted RNA-binding Zn-ribbon protein involved in translation (DUF1610 family)
MAYYVRIRGKVFGPFDETQLVDMKTNGKLGRTTEISEDRIEWSPASEFEFLFAPPSPSPSYQQQAGFQPGNAGLFCSSCGNQVVQTAVMCPHCGSPINKTSQNYGQNYNFNSFGKTSTSDGIGYFDVLKKYVQFSGRACRKEYWNFALINVLIRLILLCVGFFVIGFVSGANNDPDLIAVYEGFLSVLDSIYSIYQIVIFLPSLAVLVRRLHDTGKSGWMVLIILIPIVGFIILFILLIRDSQPGDNQYGPNPKQINF